MYDANDSTFTQVVLEAEGPVLVDLWAGWCAPCHEIAPIIAQLDRDLKGELKIVKVNVDDNPRTFHQYSNRAVPTLVIFKNGKPICTQAGAPPKSALYDWVISCIGKKRKGWLPRLISDIF